MQEKISRANAKTKKLTRFFTGAPCEQGHIAERLTSNGACIVCHRKKVHDRARSVKSLVRDLRPSPGYCTLCGQPYEICQGSQHA